MGLRWRWVASALAIIAVAGLAIAMSYRLIAFALFDVKTLLLTGHGEDQWLYVYLLRIEIEKVLGLDAGGIWNGAFFYPLHASSILLTETQWGVSMALLPVWLLVRDEYLTLGIGASLAVVLGWIGAYGFARHLGAGRLAATVAAAALGTSGAFHALLIRPFFWPFPLVILLLWLTGGVCLSPRRRWIAAFALAFGALAWSSGHLTIMGAALVAAQAGFCFHARLAPAGAGKRLAIAAAAAAALVAIPLVPQAIALERNGLERPLALQAKDAPNLASFVGGYWSETGQKIAQTWLPPPTGEFLVGLPPFALAFAALAFAVAVARAKPGPAARGIRPVTAALAGAVPGVLAALLVPAGIAGVTMDRPAIAWIYGIAGAVIVVLRRRLTEVLRTPAGWFFACAVAFGLLAVGPVIRLDDAHGIPSPALLVCRLPGFTAIRTSVRWALPCAFCLAISTALAVGSLRRRIRLVATVALLLALLLDAWQHAHGPVPMPPPPTDAWHPRAVDELLRATPGPGAVLELPVWATQRESERMIARLHHRRPLVNGYGGMIPAFFRDHWVEPNGQIRASGTLDARNVDLLRAFGARFWVVHLDELEPGVRGKVPDAFGPIRKIATLDDGTTLVYEDPAPVALAK